MRVSVLIAAALAVMPPFAQDSTVIRAGLVIDRTTTLRRGAYRIQSANIETPVITIRGSNIDLDLSGVELIGSPEKATPDQYQGLAILIDGGERVSIRNAKVRGFKVGILARNVKDLRLSGNDVSRNWKQRLYSRVEKESLVDWMSYHNNEKDEWLRYGAGLYLTDIDGARIDRNLARQGQNGLMITRSRNLTIWNNDFSFLSSLGTGLRVPLTRNLHLSKNRR
jgi:nitrous oxidase accessory protein NosD